MRSVPLPMNPDDLAKYDADLKSESNLRAALQDASDRRARAIYRLITGVPFAQRGDPDADRT